ncbi:hypothetical protein MAR_007989 [Mya arenaria]|uniref:Uncharacterized protein n=1 Tax=Mya arenaria TaxID=6604 RepID=A0ABY7DXL6_MYAAR|nr:uncharacterized protein LOC128230550 [Mya arenaria]WAR01431.1 hypothetical protein MAR_007989 [Mya arenaria]
MSNFVITLETKMSALEERINNLSVDNDKPNQYSRRNCLRVSGIEEGQGESTDKIVIDLIKAIGADVSLDQIDRTHRLGKPRTMGPNQPANKRPRDIFIKFVSYRLRQPVYKSRTKLKSAGYKMVFINEELTKQRAELFSRTRRLFKEELVDSVWTFDGVIFIKDKSQNVHRIETPDAFESFKTTKELN